MYTGRKVVTLLFLLRQAARTAKESIDEIATQIVNHHGRRMEMFKQHSSECPWHQMARVGRRSRGGRFGRRHGRRCFSTMRICRDQTLSTMRSPTFWTHNSRFIVKSATQSPVPLMARAGLSTIARDGPPDLRRQRYSIRDMHQRPMHKRVPKPEGHQVMRHIWSQQRSMMTMAPQNMWLFNLASLSLPQHSFNLDSIRQQRPGDKAVHFDTIPSEPTPSSYVDFEVAPRFSLPARTELTEEAIDTLYRDLEAYAADIKRTITDIKRVARLGELPISIERNNGVIRVHFPNADSDRVEALMADVESTRGVVFDNVDFSGSSTSNSGSSSSRSSSSDASTLSYDSDVYGMNSTEEGYCLSFSEEDLPTPSLTRGSSANSPDESEAMFERL